MAMRMDAWRARKSGVALGLLKTFSKIAGQVRQVSPGRSLNLGAQVESPVAPGALIRFDNLAPKTCWSTRAALAILDIRAQNRKCEHKKYSGAIIIPTYCLFGMKIRE